MLAQEMELGARVANTSKKLIGIIYKLSISGSILSMIHMKTSQRY